MFVHTYFMPYDIIIDVTPPIHYIAVSYTHLDVYKRQGKGLHVSRLTLEKGEVDIEGTVDSLVYSSNETYRKQGESLFARLFK